MVHTSTCVGNHTDAHATRWISAHLRRSTPKYGTLECVDAVHSTLIGFAAGAPAPKEARQGIRLRSAQIPNEDLPSGPPSSFASTRTGMASALAESSPRMR